MSKTAFQVLESVEADFEKLTWSFNISSNGWVGGGMYAVMPSETFMKMSARLAHAEALLRRYLQGGESDQLREHVEAHFDPEPL